MKAVGATRSRPVRDPRTYRWLDIDRDCRLVTPVLAVWYTDGPTYLEPAGKLHVPPCRLTFSVPTASLVRPSDPNDLARSACAPFDGLSRQMASGTYRRLLALYRSLARCGGFLAA